MKTNMKMFECRKDGHSSVHNEACYSCKKNNETEEDFSSCSGTSGVSAALVVVKQRVFTTTQWMKRTEDSSSSSKSRFLAALLLRCSGTGSVSVLRRIHGVLQVTSGKDFTYTRSQKPSSGEDTVARCISSWDRTTAAAAPADPLGGVEVLDVWDWFSSDSTPDWARASYLLHVLRLCDPEQLRMLGNLTSVLLAREKRALVPCERRGEPGEMDSSDDQEDEPALRVIPGSSGDDQEDEPALRVIPGSSASLSGVRRHCDFLRCLPVHLAKRILGVLDKSSLRFCRDVSVHWRVLAEETAEDTKTQTLLRNHIMIMQNSSNNWWVSDVFANMVDVPVPVMEHDDDDEQEEEDDVLSNVHKDGPFKAVYSDVRTKMVEMEERNVYCGVYNVRVLLEKEDPYRTVDYCGGALVVLGSRDRLVRVLPVGVAERRRRRAAAAVALKGHAGSVRALLLCEDRHMVISAGYDLHIRCWDLRTVQCVLLLSGHSATITCLDQQGDTLVSGAKDHKVKVWSLQTGRCREELRFRHPSCVRCVKIHAALVYSSCDRGLVKTWDLHRGALLRVINVHQRPVKCLYVDQWHLVSGDSDGQVMAWSSHCDAKHCLNTFTHPQEVRCVTLSFLRLITGCLDGKIRVFHFLTGDCLRVLKTYSPVLSLHCHGFTVLVNTTSKLQLYQFAKVQWDYTVSMYGGQRDGGGGGGCTQSAEERSSAAAAASVRTSAPPGVLVRARPASPPSLKTSDLSAKKAERPPPPQTSRRVRFLSARGPVRRGEDELTQRPVSSCGLHGSKRDKACISLGPRLMTRPPSVLYPGRPGRWRSQESLRQTHRTSHTPAHIITSISSARGGGGDLGRHASSAAQGENVALSERAKSRAGPPRRPLTTPRVALRVNAVRQGQLTDEAGLNMELNGRLRDAWGSPPPPPDPPETTTLKHKKPPRSFGKNVGRTLRGAGVPPTTGPVLLRATPPRPRTAGDTCLPEHRPPPPRSPRSHTEETRPRTQPAARRVGLDVDPLVRKVGLDVDPLARRVGLDVDPLFRKVGLLDPFREQGGGFMLLTDVQLEEYVLSHRNL